MAMGKIIAEVLKLDNELGMKLFDEVEEMHDKQGELLCKIDLLLEENNILKSTLHAYYTGKNPKGA